MKIEQVSVQADHCHLLIRAPRRCQFQYFFRALAGQIAQRLEKEGLLAVKNQAKKRVTDTPGTLHARQKTRDSRKAKSSGASSPAALKVAAPIEATDSGLTSNDTNHTSSNTTWYFEGAPGNQGVTDTPSTPPELAGAVGSLDSWLQIGSFGVGSSIHFDLSEARWSQKLLGFLMAKESAVRVLRMQLRLGFALLVLVAAFTSKSLASESSPAFVVKAHSCDGNAPAETLNATFIAEVGRTFIVSRAPQHPAEGLCFSLQDGAKLKLIASDPSVGLALFESPSQLSVTAAALNMTGYLRTESVQTTNGPGRIVARNSSRHFFASGWSAYEVQLSQNQNGAGFWNLAGTPVINSEGILGIFTDESVLLVSGQPAKTIRDRDLPLQSSLPSTKYRLALDPDGIAKWIFKMRTAPQAVPRIIQPTELKNGRTQTLWETPYGSRILEECLSTSERNESRQFPIGGVQPVGIGGLEDVLSDCRLSSLNAHGANTRIYLAYKKEGTLYRIQSLANALAYLRLQESREWNFLIEEATAISTLTNSFQQAAEKSRQLILDFYKNEEGDPLVLRKAFLLVSLSMGSLWQTVTAEDLTNLVLEIEEGLSTDAGGIGIRFSRDDSDFARAKKQLIANIKDLKREREKWQ